MPVTTNALEAVANAARVAIDAINESNNIKYLDSYCRMNAADYSILLIPNPSFTTLYIKIYLESKSHLTEIDELYQRSISTKLRDKEILKTAIIEDIQSNLVDAMGTWELQPDRMINIKLIYKNSETIGAQAYLCQRLVNN